MIVLPFRGRRQNARRGDQSDDRTRLVAVQTAQRGPVDRLPSETDSDHARFAWYVLPHLDQAFSLARWMTGNRSDAEDVVQEACLRAFAAIETVTHGDGRAWVLTIVRNTANSWLRKNRPIALVMVDDLEAVESTQADASARDAETPETALLAKCDAARLEAAIETLPTVYRETLVLRDVQGLAYREIAQITEVPIGTVMSRLARARNHMIKAIGTNS